MENLRDRVAVVTGAASGIGRAVAAAAAAEGMKLALVDVEPAALQGAAEELSATTEVEALVADVADGDAMAAVRDRVLDRFGVVDLLHNNAGVGVGGPLWAVSESDWRWILGVNLWGVVHGIRLFVPQMVERGEGHVVNTASVAGLTSPAFLGPYNATKHAVTTISETLHRDLRTLGSPVGVSVLCPGFVQTGIAESDRNRPDWAPAASGDPTADVTRDFIRQLVAGGIEPAVVGRRVIEAVRDGTFYILTHDDTRPMVRARMEDILEGRSPTEAPIA